MSKKKKTIWIIVVLLIVYFVVPFFVDLSFHDEKYYASSEREGITKEKFICGLYFGAITIDTFGKSQYGSKCYSPILDRIYNFKEKAYPLTLKFFNLLPLYKHCEQTTHGWSCSCDPKKGDKLQNLCKMQDKDANFNRFGVLGTCRCNFKLSDAGKECKNSSECEGYCITSDPDVIEELQSKKFGENCIDGIKGICSRYDFDPSASSPQYWLRCNETDKTYYGPWGKLILP